MHSVDALEGLQICVGGSVYEMRSGSLVLVRREPREGHHEGTHSKI